MNTEETQTQEEILEETAQTADTADTAPEVEVIEDTAPQTQEEGSEMQEQMKQMIQEVVRQQEDKYLRLAAEYDNFRKRTAKEKESIWMDAKSDTVTALLPVYDNLERALKQETTDEAYKKGVEMTMVQLKAVLEKLGITEIEAQGQPFDPNRHNAVMHIENPDLGENVVCEVFQAGFQMGEKVVRFAMVQVAN